MPARSKGPLLLGAPGAGPVVAREGLFRAPSAGRPGGGASQLSGGRDPLGREAGTVPGPGPPGGVGGSWRGCGASLRHWPERLHHVCERFSLSFSSLPRPSPRPLPRSLRVLLRPAAGNLVSEPEQHGAAEREPVPAGQPRPAQRQPRRQGASPGEGGAAGAERQPHGSPREAQRRSGQGRGR